MGMLRKIASVSTLGIVDFRDPAEAQVHRAKKVKKADARVARLAQQSAQLAAQRSRAEVEAAQREADRLRADLVALQLKYTALERGVRT